MWNCERYENKILETSAFSSWKSPKFQEEDLPIGDTPPRLPKNADNFMAQDVPNHFQKALWTHWYRTTIPSCFQMNPDTFRGFSAPRLIKGRISNVLQNQWTRNLDWRPAPHQGWSRFARRLGGRVRTSTSHRWRRPSHRKRACATTTRRLGRT